MNKSPSVASVRKALACLLTMFCFRGAVFSGEQFTEVDNGAFNFVQQATTSWGNPIWGDIDLDGDLDLIIPTNTTDPLVYKNNGNDNFSRILNGTSNGRSGITLPSGYNTDWRGFSFGDYDGDGKLDLYIAANYLPPASAMKSNLLFHGTGGPPATTYFTQVTGTTFENETRQAQTGFWLDSDNDGNLELFVKNYFTDDQINGKNFLYEYSGGVFANIIGSGSNLERAVFQTFDTGHEYGHGTICSFADYDNNNTMDVAFSGLRKALYVKTTAWTEDLILPEQGESCKGIAWGDYDNDNDLDLYVTTGSFDDKQVLGTHLYRKNSDGTFTDVAKDVGVYTEANTWAAVWGDYDNDGYLDLLVTCSGGVAGPSAQDNGNILYRNNGPSGGAYTFSDQTPNVIRMADNESFHKTAAWGDYNNDGFLDLVVKDGIEGTTGISHLIKNNGNSYHSVEVKLDGLGPGQGSNDRGIGARVKITFAPSSAEALRQGFRVNNGGGGGEYDSQGSQPLHFGVKTAGSATVTVDWPGGTHDVRAVTSSEFDTVITITEGCCD